VSSPSSPSTSVAFHHIRFLRGLLDYYNNELQHLNPNGI
jgi:hypothetical protein